MSTNRDRIIERIWDNPSAVFGHPYKRGGNARRKEIPALQIALCLTSDGKNITVHGNGRASGIGGGGVEKSVFDYLCAYVFNIPVDFPTALQRCAEIYGETLEHTAEERKRYGRRRLAQEIAKILADSLSANPTGEAARYLESRKQRISDNYGELTPAVIRRVEAELRTKGIEYTPEDLATLGVTEYNAAKGYTLVIIHREGGTPTGFVYRNTQGNTPKMKASADLVRGAFSPNPVRADEYGFTRVYVTEGEIDAIRLSYAGFNNVVALGGWQNKKHFAKFLQYCGADEVVIIPDIENVSGSTERDYKKIDTIAEIVKVGGFDCSIAELNRPEGVDKVDVDSYAQIYGEEILRDEIIAKTETYAKHRIKRVEAEIRRFAGTEHDKRQFARREYTKRLNEEKSVFARFDVANYAKQSEIFQSVGITPEYIDNKEKHDRSAEYQAELKELFADAAKSEQIDSETAGEILNRLRRIKATNDGAPVELSRDLTDEILSASLIPPPLRTKWAMGYTGRQGFRQEEFISFAPADITLIAAPTGHGKSTILTQAAIDILKEHPQKFIIYVSTEETPAFVLMRIVNNCLSIGTRPDGLTDGVYFNTHHRKATIKAILSASTPPAELGLYGGDMYKSKQIADNYDELTREVHRQTDDLKKNLLPRFIRVNVGTDADAVIARIERLSDEITKRGGEVAAVFVDYIQQMTAAGKFYGRVEEMKYICDELKRSAVRVGAPYVVAAQLNRSATKDGIDDLSLSNIGEASDIEKIANAVYIIWNTSKTAQQLNKYNDNAKDSAKCASFNEATDIIAKPANIGIRANRIFTKVKSPDAKATPQRTLKTGYYYVEHFKSRETAGGAWALLPFDGERGYIGETDENKMLE